MISTIVYNGTQLVDRGGTKAMLPANPSMVLMHGGPMLNIRITHPKSVIDQLAKEGKTPQHADVKALIDTGAAGSIITPEIATKLGLIQTGFRNITSVHDKQDRPAYYCIFMFPWGRGKEVAVASCSLKGIDCLIGRDILQHWHVKYNGKDGILTICD